ncbi:hypothetical protein [Streptomyces sp. NPDC054975]
MITVDTAADSSDSHVRAAVADRAYWLVGLAVVFSLVQLVLVVPGAGLGWDEAVYVSQVGGNAPPAFFSAPRARGVSYLVAPVAVFTGSTSAIRVYLAVLSGVGLWGALRVWRGILPVSVLTVGGALFAGLWVTLFYGPRVMPNLWCAFGALAAVGLFVRVVRGGRAAVLGLGGVVAGVMLFRPGDGVWLALPLCVAAVVMSVRGGVAVVGGAVLGAVPWVVEAYARYGGLAARLRRAGEIQGHLGWYLSVDDHVRALAGRTLCRPCDVAWEHPVTAVWWLLLPVVVVVGVVAAFRGGRGVPVLLATVTAVSMAGPYLLTVGYAAPRFLLPAYALLALAVGEGVRCLVGVRWRAAVVGVCLVGHLAVQYAVLDRAVSNSRSVREQFTGIAAALHDAGVRPPCLVSGLEYVMVGYYAGCSSRQTRGHDASITVGGIVSAARRMPVAVVVPAGAAPPSYVRGWRVVPLPAARGWERYDAYVSGPATPGGVAGVGQAERPSSRAISMR